MATKKLDITQQGGIVVVSRNGEAEWRVDCARYIQRIKEGNVSPEDMANFIAETIHDCLNSKTVVATLTDLDELDQYHEETYFSGLG